MPLPSPNQHIEAPPLYQCGSIASYASIWYCYSRDANLCLSEHLSVSCGIVDCGNLCLGTLVPASSLEALHQLLSHDSNKNKSQVVVSGSAASQDRLQSAVARSSSVHPASLTQSSSSNLSTQLAASSTEQSQHDQRTGRWPATAKHLSMPSLVEFL